MTQKDTLKGVPDKFKKFVKALENMEGRIEAEIVKAKKNNDIEREKKIKEFSSELQNDLIILYFISEWGEDNDNKKHRKKTIPL